MQKVDVRVLERLIDRFFELDPDKSGSLTLGVEVPNAEQVVEMQAMTEGTGMTLQEAWKKHLSCKYRLRAEVFLPDKGEFLGKEGEDEGAVVKKSELTNIVKESSELRGSEKSLDAPRRPESRDGGVDSPVKNKFLPATKPLSAPSLPSTLEGRMPVEQSQIVKSILPGAFWGSQSPIDVHSCEHQIIHFMNLGCSPSPNTIKGVIQIEGGRPGTQALHFFKTQFNNTSSGSPKRCASAKF